MRLLTGFIFIAAFLGVALSTNKKDDYQHGINRENEHQGSEYQHGKGHHRQGSGYQGGHGYRQGSKYHQKNGYHQGGNYGYKKVICSKLPDPAYGHVKLSGLYPGDKAVYKCSVGYVLVGLDTRKCLSDGKWSGEAPICKYKKVICSKLPDPAYGHVKVDGVYPGDKAVYKCSVGYVLVGLDTRKCLSDGKWSGEAPICKPYGYHQKNGYHQGGNYGYKKVICSKLPDPAYGHVKVNGLYPGDKAVYKCSVGYVLVGLDTRKCLRDGKWSGEAPICKRINCGLLPDIANGKVDITPDTRFGSTATYSCITGHDLVGISTRRCKADGQWSGQEPRCDPVNCGRLRAPRSGWVHISPDTKLGAVAIYKCRLGYYLNGKERRYCQANRKWSGSPPSCERRDCGPPPPPDPKGNIIIRGTKLRDPASYSCLHGYILEGSRTVYCQADGTWSDKAPICKPVDCGAPDPPDPNGNLKYDKPTLGGTAYYYCSLGYDLVGKSIATCLYNGRWSNKAPTCKPVDCGGLPAPKNGDVYFYPDTTFHSTANFVCKKGFLLVGSKVRTCQANRKWSGKQPICKKLSCPKLKTPSYGKIYISGYYPGDYAEYKCEYGYKLVGKARRQCLYSGYWSENDVTCVKDDSYYYDNHGYNPHHNKYPPHHKKYD